MEEAPHNSKPNSPTKWQVSWIECAQMEGDKGDEHLLKVKGAPHERNIFGKDKWQSHNMCHAR